MDMKQTADESKFIPFSAEAGKEKEIEKIRLAYSLLLNLGSANRRRYFLFSNEGQGYRNALSIGHNKARFRNRTVLLPRREAEQSFKAKMKEKNKKRIECIKALKYGRRYGTITLDTIQRSKQAGIRIKRNTALNLPIAEIQRQLTNLISSGMMDK